MVNGKKVWDVPEKMLEQFVADLTCGAGSGGSDERDLAERWYYRSFEMMGRRYIRQLPVQRRRYD